MKVTVHYYAMLREKAGVSEETFDFDGTDVGALFEAVTERHGFELPWGAMRTAVNGSFVSQNELLHEGDVVVFVPPVAGG